MTPGTAETDSILLEKIRLDSDREAYRALYLRYYPILVAYAEMFVRTEDAEDIVQDRLLRLWTDRNDLEQVKSPGSFLFTCVRNSCLDMMRHNRVHNRNMTELWKSLAEEATDTGCYHINEIRKLIYDALDDLPLPQRRAFEMSRFEGRTYRDIARAMSVSEKTVEYRISKALEKMQAFLTDYLPATVITVLLMSNILSSIGNPCNEMTATDYSTVYSSECSSPFLSTQDIL